jgi:ABC-type multidrug transport system ATPase subunit
VADFEAIVSCQTITGSMATADKPISQFSGGMRRRLDLAGSLITRPPLIFLDEPTTGLDPRTRGEMWDTIRGLAADGCTIMLTMQDLDEADRVAVIDRSGTNAACRHTRQCRRGMSPRFRGNVWPILGHLDVERRGR